MNDETTTDAGLDSRARRARALIYGLMVVFVVAPFVVWFLVDLSVHK